MTTATVMQDSMLTVLSIYWPHACNLHLCTFVQCVSGLNLGEIINIQTNLINLFHSVLMVLYVFFQLIQDEIKALVQLQNRQISTQTHSLEPSKNPKPLEDLVESTFTSSAPGPLWPPQLTVHSQESSEEGMVTVLSSGYGTLSTWEHRLETGRPSSTEGRDEALWSPNQQDGSLTPSPIPDTSPLGHNPLIRANDKLQTTETVSLDVPTDKQRVIR